MARGMPYDQAHPIATQAERTVAEHMGIELGRLLRVYGQGGTAD